MGCFYVGHVKGRAKDCIKIGETSGNTPAKRLANIRKVEDIELIAYIEMSGESKAERLAVEALARVGLERVRGLKNVQNDHFEYTTKSADPIVKAEKIAKQAIRMAEEACDMLNVMHCKGRAK